ncbi:hypothetical protein Tco_0474053 [Tanacetum coccineum]
MEYSLRNVKLIRGLKESNLISCMLLENNEVHANENRMMKERFISTTNVPLAIVSNASKSEECWRSEKNGNVNPGQAKPIYVLQSAKESAHRHEMKERLLFLAGEQVNNFDEDMDDLALNVDHVFEADQCDVIRLDVDEAPTHTMFMDVQSMSINKPDKVVNDSVTSELARYKELVGVYEQRAKVLSMGAKQGAGFGIGGKIGKGYSSWVVTARGVQTALFKEVKVMEEIFDQMSNEVEQNVVESNVMKFSVKTKVLAPGMYAIDVKPVPHPLKNNRSAYLKYINHLKESVETVREIVEEARVVKPLDNALNYACQYTKLSQELIEYVIGTCPKEIARLLLSLSVNATPTVKIVLNKGKQIWKPKGKLSNNSLNKTKQVWKATSKLFANVGYQWRPTGKKFSSGKLNCGYQWRPTGKKFALGELCPLTRLPVTCTTMSANRQDPNTNWGSEIPNPPNDCFQMRWYRCEQSTDRLLLLTLQLFLRIHLFLQRLLKMHLLQVIHCHPHKCILRSFLNVLQLDQLSKTPSNYQDDLHPSVNPVARGNPSSATVLHLGVQKKLRNQIFRALTASADVPFSVTETTGTTSTLLPPPPPLQKPTVMKDHKGVKASANSDIIFFFTSAQDGNKLLDDERLSLADDLKKAHDQNQNKSK